MLIHSKSIFGLVAVKFLSLAPEDFLSYENILFPLYALNFKMRCNTISGHTSQASTSLAINIEI
jgi:hypothetical protein